MSRIKICPYTASTRANWGPAPNRPPSRQCRAHSDPRRQQQVEGSKDEQEQLVVGF